MSVVKAFEGIVYNSSKVKDLQQVICPPYDVISSEKEALLKKRSPFNFIHVMLAKTDAKHGDDDKRYEQAAVTLKKWLADGVMVRDPKPCIYFLKQEYRILGQKYSRTGFLAVMKLENDRTRIHPHEKTHAGAKEDRFKLWSALEAACSPIFVCFSDRQKKVENVFQKKVIHSQPFMDVTEDDGVRNIVWRLDDPQSIADIADTFEGQNLFIADGHHRYEVAGRYRQMMLERYPNATGDEPWNYVMTYFTNIDSKDLQIFPIHRIVKHFPVEFSFLENLFRIHPVKTREELAILLAKAGLNEHAFGLYTKKGIYLLRLKNLSQIDEFIKEGSRDYRTLDSLILKSFVFDQLGIKSEDITYSNKDIEECCKIIDGGEAEAAFILNPVRIEQLRAIALNGEKMPPKTTYFFPKALSGIALYSLK